MRDCLQDRWVRFHSLPGSQRYAADERQYREILRRHQVGLGELAGATPAEPGAVVLFVVTASWSASPGPAPRAAKLANVMPAVYWTSIGTDDDSDPEVKSYVYSLATLAVIAPPGSRPTATTERPEPA